VPLSATFESALSRDGKGENAGKVSDPSAAREREVADLVAAARKGDSRAFEGLVRLYRNEVFALSHHFVRNREEAWDLSQDVFVKAYRGLKRFRGDSSFKTWLMRITANQAKDFLKKRRVETVSFDEAIETKHVSSQGLDPRRQLEASEIGEAISAAVRTLSEKHRTAFVLREFEGLSYEEMAKVMKCGPGTVMSRLHHARKRVQRFLLKRGIAEDYSEE
jgi:RNA polymerase sigma-70 factor, ECF subfamily